MAASREGSGERVKNDPDPIFETPLKKVAMTSVERSRKYRERLKTRTDYKVIKEKHLKQNQVYRQGKKVSATEEEKEAARAKTRERVRKHRELKKLRHENEAPCKKKEVTTEEEESAPANKQEMGQKHRELKKLGDENVTSRKKKEVTGWRKEKEKEKNRERKRKERSQWTSQQWRRHREICREFYAKKKAKIMKDTTEPGHHELLEKTHSFCSPQNQQRAVGKVKTCLPRDKEQRNLIIKDILKIFGSVINGENKKSLKTERKVKRKKALQVLRKAKSERKKVQSNQSLRQTVKGSR